MARMRIDWTLEKSDFLINNWGAMTIVDMAAALKMSTTAVTDMANKLNLREANPTFISTQCVRNVGKKFKLGQAVKIKLKSRRSYKIVKGTVVGKTEWLVVVREKNHRQSFEYVEFCIGEAEVI
ncbi:hypothetical protein ACJDU8_19790 [Clostridium sp. WILCCON 0269]|uniref:MarR family transcriptional regulator n=1 Tax=Candidatus Clostridium eludens TaxID=3381663 RepID=A0ABW8SPF2_9CLOT